MCYHLKFIDPVLYQQLLMHSCLWRACKMAEGLGSSFLLPVEYTARDHRPAAKIPLEGYMQQFDTSQKLCLRIIL